MATPNLNRIAVELCHAMMESADRLRVAGHRSQPGGQGATIMDCGIDMPGGIEAGRRLAEVCLAGLGHVRLIRSDPAIGPGPAVQVRTDFPVAACLASQYAGWEIKGEDYFAMGSGPMRAVAGREALYGTIGYQESATECVGVLESNQRPPDAVCRDVAEKCGVPVENLTLLVAPTRSLAGTVQVVARSIETALHKLYALQFDLSRIESGYGTAPLPPPAADTRTAIGRTNDAILYGGEVTLYVRGDDPSLEAIVANLPSSASPDHGRPFAQIFADYGYDFYRIDPFLFSPAVVVLVNIDTGTTFRSGQLRNDVLLRSFT